MLFNAHPYLGCLSLHADTCYSMRIHTLVVCLFIQIHVIQCTSIPWLSVSSYRYMLFNAHSYLGCLSLHTDTCYSMHIHTLVVCLFIQIHVIQCTFIPWLSVSSCRYMLFNAHSYLGCLSLHTDTCYSMHIHTLVVCLFMQIHVIQCTSIPWLSVSSYRYMLFNAHPYLGCLSLHADTCYSIHIHTLVVCLFVQIHVIQCTSIPWLSVSSCRYMLFNAHPYLGCLSLRADTCYSMHIHTLVVCLFVQIHVIQCTSIPWLSVSSCRYMLFNAHSYLGCLSLRADTCYSMHIHTLVVCLFMQIHVIQCTSIPWLSVSSCRYMLFNAHSYLGCLSPRADTCYSMHIHTLAVCLFVQIHVIQCTFIPWLSVSSCRYMLFNAHSYLGCLSLRADTCYSMHIHTLVVCLFVQIHVIQCTFIPWLSVSSCRYMLFNAHPYLGCLSLHADTCYSMHIHTLVVCLFIQIHVIQCTSIPWLSVSSYRYMLFNAHPYLGCLSLHTDTCYSMHIHTLVVCLFVQIHVIQCTSIPWLSVSSCRYMLFNAHPYLGCLSLHTDTCYSMHIHTLVVCLFIQIHVIQCTSIPWLSVSSCRYMLFNAHPYLGCLSLRAGCEMAFATSSASVAMATSTCKPISHGY